MPQEHHVLRCFSCETFQVHIVKKTNKWACKICGAKQTVKRNYGIGSGKDCRNQVMKLNQLRVSGGSSSKLIPDDTFEEESFVEEFKEPDLAESGKEPGQGKPFQSKWMEYLEENTTSGGSENEDNTVSSTEMDFTKKKRAKKQYKSNQNYKKKICRNFKTSDEPSSKVYDELNPSFLIDETFEGDDNKTVCEIVALKNNYKKHSFENKNALKQSKYAKYLDDNDDDNNSTQVNKS